MEKTAASASEAATVAAKAVASKAVASKAVASASEEAAVAAVASASEEAAVTSKTVPASDVAAGALADGSRSKTPLGWDPYEKDKYIRPANPFDTSLEDPWAEESGSDVGSDVESVDTKTRQVLRRLQSGQYDDHFANGVFRCSFCTRRPGATDFNCVVRHAECISSCNPKVGESVNVNSHFAKHKALGLHLRKLQEVTIAEGRMPPKRSAPGSIRWHKRRRRDVAQMEAEARRRG